MCPFTLRASFLPKKNDLWPNGSVVFRPSEWPIILHPDVICDFALWRSFGSQLAIENMDRRKPFGRTVEELRPIFDELPNATMCFDIGHARQCDTSMTEAYKLLKNFQNRLKQIHISEVNTSSQHDPISYAAKLAFQEVASLIPVSIPVIIESRVAQSQISQEIVRATEALPEFGPVLTSHGPLRYTGTAIPRF
jgi:Xylose isomerase-like TIM barrel